MKKKIIILGASGASLDILSIIEDINSAEKKKFEFLGFLEDNQKKIPNRIKKYHIGKFTKLNKKHTDVFYISAFGSELNYKNRPKIIENLSLEKRKFTNIIHPTCLINKNSKIGLGNVFHAYVTISRDVIIKDHVVILPKVTISHDTRIESYNIINTNCIISGNVVIEENCYLGAGSNIRDHITVKKKSLIGMGSVVIKSVLKTGVFAGNPAKNINKK